MTPTGNSLLPGCLWYLIFTVNLTVFRITIGTHLSIRSMNHFQRSLIKEGRPPWMWATSPYVLWSRVDWKRCSGLSATLYFLSAETMWLTTPVLAIILSLLWQSVYSNLVKTSSSVHMLLLSGILLQEEHNQYSDGAEKALGDLPHWQK